MVAKSCFALWYRKPWGQQEQQQQQWTTIDSKSSRSGVVGSHLDTTRVTRTQNESLDGPTHSLCLPLPLFFFFFFFFFLFVCMAGPGIIDVAPSCGWLQRHHDWSLHYYSTEGVNSLSVQHDTGGSERKTPGHESSGQRSHLEEVRIFR